MEVLTCWGKRRGGNLDSGPCFKHCVRMLLNYKCKMCRQPLGQEPRTSSSKGAPIRVANYPLSMNLASSPVQKYGFSRHDRQFSSLCFTLSWWQMHSWEMWERSPQKETGSEPASPTSRKSALSTPKILCKMLAVMLLQPLDMFLGESLWGCCVSWQGWCMLGLLRRCLPHEASQEVPHLYITGRLWCKVGFKILSCIEIAVAIGNAIAELLDHFISKNLM